MVLFNACMSYYLNKDFLLRMSLVMSDELGMVERVLNTPILVNTDWVQTYRTTLYAMMFVDYLFDSILSVADHYFWPRSLWLVDSYCRIVSLDRDTTNGNFVEKFATAKGREERIFSGKCSNQQKQVSPWPNSFFLNLHVFYVKIYLGLSTNWWVWFTDQSSPRLVRFKHLFIRRLAFNLCHSGRLDNQTHLAFSDKILLCIIAISPDTSAFGSYVYHTPVMYRQQLLRMCILVVVKGIWNYFAE